jgi:glycosyltransferase involved in cell wall biosynthesis
MPVFNGERYISSALDSILAQTYTDFELIICDNASTDSTEKICREYLKRDERIKYFRNSRNIGASRNYTRVFKLSKGHYFRWANHDDLFAEESLARCIEILDHNNAVVLVYPKTKFINADGEIISEYKDNLNLQSSLASERFVLYWQQVGMINVIYGLIRSAILKKTALMGNFIGADITFVAELTLYGKFYEIPEFLFFRRIHQDAFCAQKDPGKLWAFYMPEKLERLQLSTCLHLWASFLAIRRSPLKISDKLILYRHFERMVRWNRWKILRELYNVILLLWSRTGRILLRYVKCFVFKVT